ncbi:MAG: hypothetical protein PHE97_01885 [Candidatus Omnitrophica bacterium]|nr:hypothetical protein [Candidatus Omnitrophota bacterium]
METINVQRQPFQAAGLPVGRRNSLTMNDTAIEQAVNITFE